MKTHTHIFLMFKLCYKNSIKCLIKINEEINFEIFKNVFLRIHCCTFCRLEDFH